MTPTHSTAWVDESASNQFRDPGAYLLAAALDTCGADLAARERMRHLQLKGQLKVHWRKESHSRRTSIVAGVAETGLALLVVVREGNSSENPERQRRKCLERLIFELDARSIDEIVLESRVQPETKEMLTW